MNFLSCPVDVVQSNGIAQCPPGFDIVTAQQIIQSGLQNSLPDPGSMLLAFSAGLAVMVPLYVVLWGIRAARESIKST
ncbi:hypothetical protein [Thalassolituus sp.]|jgi:hypothetical protein|uniref:hypothetical protein n=1 Tax=Thalassolituus sp. TaxID=2030822 RepID=UPI002A7F9698|nr:hypothetical protein [Thalassolituus sp.]